MKVFVTGGTGFIGRHLSRMLEGEGHELTILTRSGRASSQHGGGISYVEGDPTEKGPWQEVLARHEAVINLAGAPIFRRWTAKYKRVIRESRIRATRNVVEALAGASDRSIHLLNASAVGYYGFHGDETIDEGGEPGDDFLAGVAHDWEAAAGSARDEGARVVLCRFGIVLGADGGALAQMVQNFRRYPVSVVGSGQQWVSWIHVDDLSAIFAFLLKREEIEGPVNCVAPEPVRNRELTELVARRLQKGVSRLRVPRFAFRLAMGEFADVLTKGQRVRPGVLLESGFTFEFPELEDALKDFVA
jgi:uncharacterized protein (TIGR01777 family)